MTTTPTEMVVLPDVERILVTYLMGLDDLDGLRISTVVPAGSEIYPILPVLRVNRVGGSWLHRKQLDDATVAFDLWHNATAMQALNETLQTVRAAVEAMTTYAAHGGVVTRTREVSGPRRLPEDDPRLVRAGFIAGLLVRPQPT